MAWTRRQVLAQFGIAAATIHTLDPHEICCSVDAHAATHEKNLFELKKVADGVYAAFAGPAYKVNSNSAVILTNDGVIVVDTHSKPSAATALYKDIQGVTKNPVKKIINTHFHWDHWQGNEIYKGAYPALEIIASEQTRQNMTKPDAGVGGLPHIERQIAALPAEIEKLKEEVARTSDAEAKARVQSNLRQAETYLEELKKMKPAPPTRGVPGGVTTLREGGREIQLHVVGRAHTDGDVFVYLPKEKVLVTGDAVVDWMPFIGDGFPEDWVQSLATLEKLDFTHIIPGHGDVAPKAQITFLKNYLADLIAAVKKAAADRATLDEMKSKVADQLAPKYEAGMSKYWTGRYRDRIAVNIEHVHKKVVKPA
jgi:cyclase